MNNAKQLLIVDDERMIAGSLSRMKVWAEKNIYVVGTASNGKEALDIIKRQQIDIMITDIQMPDMDGLELLQTVNKQNPEISVVVISGYEKFQYARDALKYKAKGYVLKPIDVDELLEVIDEIMYESQETRDLTEPINQEDNLHRSYHEKLISQAKVYIEQHLDQPISLNEVASHFYLSPHYFGQIFKNNVGENFTAYLTGLRMNKACELLKNVDLKNYDISRQIGYIDVKYFTKQFYRTFGVTPKEFRQAYFEKD